MKAKPENINPTVDAAKEQFYDGMSAPLRSVVGKLFEVASGSTNRDIERISSIRWQLLQPRRSSISYYERDKRLEENDTKLRMVAQVPGRLEMLGLSTILRDDDILDIIDGADGETLEEDYKASHGGYPGYDIYRQTRGGLGTAVLTYALLSADVYRQLMTIVGDPEERAQKAYELLSSKTFTAGCLYIAGGQHLNTHNKRISHNAGVERIDECAAAELIPDRSPFTVTMGEDGTVKLGVNRDSIQQYWTDSDEDLKKANVDAGVKGCPAGKVAEGPEGEKLGTAIADFVTKRTELLKDMRAFENYEEYMQALAQSN